jgi:asparagine synthetase B (glutamine-hydrolysing)
MCGLAGLSGQVGEGTDFSLVEAMTSSVEHRGPDSKELVDQFENGESLDGTIWVLMMIKP